MMYASLHFDERGICTGIRWVRQGDSGSGMARQDYFTVALTGDGGEVTLFLSPSQLESLADKLSQAARDRGFVLREESSKPLTVETGGGG
jgi:hypothetical protein